MNFLCQYFLFRFLFFPSTSIISVLFLPGHLPSRAARAAVRRPYRAPVPGERSAAARRAVALHRSPAEGPVRTAEAARPGAAPAEPSCPSGPRRHPAAAVPPMRLAGSGAGSSGSRGRSRGSTGPGSGSEQAAGRAVGSTEAGSPMWAHETRAVRWSRVPRETPSPAGTGGSCGSRHRHAGPSRGCREEKRKKSVPRRIQTTFTTNESIWRPG